MEGQILLQRADLEQALDDLHLRPRSDPLSFLPPALTAIDDRAVDVTDMVCNTLPLVLNEHPIFAFMAEELMGNDDFYRSVYFGTIPPHSSSSVSFEALCRRLVASIYVFEELLALDASDHRRLAQWYEQRFAASTAAAASAADESGGGSTREALGLRDSLMGSFLTIKGSHAISAAMGGLGAALEALMALNILEAIVANLSFAFWPANARAGLALLLSPAGGYNGDGTQELDEAWWRLYLAWNACFVWPAHDRPDMLAFAMLLTPTVALGDPKHFGYRRAHSLFWVVRSTQLSRLGAAPVATSDGGAAVGDLALQPRFRCKQLEPQNDRQPITSRTAVLTRAAGERLAAAAGEDVSGVGVWWRLLTDVLPTRIRDAARLYGAMRKSSPTKLELL